MKDSTRLAITDHAAALTKLEAETKFLTLVLALSPVALGEVGYDKARKLYGEVESEKVKLVTNFVQEWLK